jgi:protein subunit release factor A
MKTIIEVRAGDGGDDADFFSRQLLTCIATYFEVPYFKGDNKVAVKESL